MYCMKCGREASADQVFCDACLAEMEQEPVRIDTPVMIPAQPVQNPGVHRRPMVNQEDELKRLRKFNQNLMLVLVLMFTLVMLLGIMLYDKEFWSAVEELGQNYSVMETFSYKIGR